MTEVDAVELRRHMVALNKSLAVAESLTCGHLQAILGSASGASDFFHGGVTAYNLDQKVRHLGVDRTHAEAVDCVSERVATEMARGCCDLFDADYGVSTTGYAEPTDNGEPPYAYTAIWLRSASGSGELLLAGRVEAPRLSRVDVQKHVALAALSALLEKLPA